MEPTVAKPAKNEGQQRAFDEIIDFVTGKDKDYHMWLLEGYAGTGKTFTTAEIVDKLNRLSESNPFESSYRIAMSAPTHKAVRVMKKFSGISGVHYATIHSLLGLREEIDNYGKAKFVQSKDPNELRIEQFNTLMLDESSMLSDELFYYLLPYVRKGLKIVFIGDPVQIPPVNHPDSMPFKPSIQDKYKIGVSRLTQIMRQAGENPILGLATTIRMGYKTVPHFQMETNKVRNSEGVVTGGIVILENDEDYMIEKIIEQFFVTPEFQADPDYMKIIAWRNKTVDEFNRIVRKRIYKQEGPLPFIMPGEKLIIDKPVIMPDTNRILLTTNEEISVRGYDIRTTDISYETAEQINGSMTTVKRQAVLRYYNTQVDFFDVNNRPAVANIRILHEEENKNLEVILKGISEAAMSSPVGPFRSRLWKSFYSVQRLFAQVKYNYAITGHKSQGSTYDNVLVLDWDIAVNKKIEERNRIRYVGFTRPRNLLFIQK